MLICSLLVIVNNFYRKCISDFPISIHTSIIKKYLIIDIKYEVAFSLEKSPMNKKNFLIQFVENFIKIIKIKPATKYKKYSITIKYNVIDS